MTTTTTRNTLLLTLLLPACLSGEPEMIGETEQSLAAYELLGTPAVKPVGGFEMRGDRIIYVGHDGTGYRAYELDEELAMMRQSPQVLTSSVPRVDNLATDGTYVLFGDGSRNMRLSLAGGSAQAFDPYGVFGKSLRGNGGVTLRDGTLARIMTGNGFGLGAWSPSEAFSGAQPTAAPVMSEGARTYVVPAGSYLRLVDTGTTTTKLLCKSSTTYATTKSLTTDHMQPKGNLRAAAKTLDGRVAECKVTPTGTSMTLHALPFPAGDIAFEGGGGFFDGGGGLGMWVASANTPELAYVTPTGKIAVYPLSGKTSITPIPIPRVVRSFSDGSAAVLMSDGKFLRITRM